MKFNKKITLTISILLVLSFASYGIYKYNEQAELKKMIGQMILVGFRGTSPDDNEVKQLAENSKQGNIGGVILFSVDIEKVTNAGFVGPEIRKQNKSRNIISVDQVTKLTKYLSDAAKDGNQPPLFISVDQEGGVVSRLMPTHGFKYVMPSAEDLAKNFKPNQVKQKYADMGKELKSLGFNLDFAPDVDVNINPKNPVIGSLGRSFSGNPDTVIKYAKAAMDGLSKSGILYSIKHFPGHGSSTGDTHLGTVDVTKTWNQKEILPYYSLAKTGMPGMVMVAHITNQNMDANYPASLSYEIINNILRKKIGFDGVVISDDLQMKAIYEKYGLHETLRYAIMAGNDIMLLGNNLKYTPNLGVVAQEEILRMVNDGEIPKSRIEKSYERIIKLKQKIK